MPAYYNTTMTDSVVTGYNAVPETAIVVFFVSVLLGILIAMYASLLAYSYFRKVWKLLSESVEYFLYGCATIIVLAVPTGIFYYIIHSAKQGNTFPLKAVLYLAAFYAVVSFIGYLSKRFLARLKQHEAKLRKGVR